MAVTTTNMGLKVWDQGTDPYDHDELEDNWNAVDVHDHSSTKGVQIPTAGLQNSAVTTAKIADNAVTAVKIPADEIGQSELAPASVGTPELIDASVTSAKIASASISGPKIISSYLPVGTVISWYRPGTSVPIPTGGWEICDGRAWNTITNDWGLNTGNIPDMRNKFILGAGFSNIGSGPSNNPDIGQPGGSHTTNLSHTHTVPHSHSIPSHSHSISTDGSHFHLYSNPVSKAFGQGYLIDPTDDSMMNFDSQGGLSGGVLFDAAVMNINLNDFTSVANPDADLYTNDNPGPPTFRSKTGDAGGHNHGASTGGTAGSTDASSPVSDFSLGSTDIRPAHIGLLFLMRVRNQ